MEHHGGLNVYKKKYLFVEKKTRIELTNVGVFFVYFQLPKSYKKMMKTCKESRLKQWLNVDFFKSSLRLNIFCGTEDMKKRKEASHCVKMR